MPALNALIFLSCMSLRRLSKCTYAQDIETLATFNEKLGEIKKGAIYVKNNVIEWVGQTESLPAEYSSADTVISLPDRVLIPGLVNTHHHMFQCLTRCIAQV